MSAVAERPKCKCGVYLELRGPSGSGATTEQKFCGVWYDHPPIGSVSMFGHIATSLYPSRELTDQLGASK